MKHGVGQRRDARSHCGGRDVDDGAARRHQQGHDRELEEATLVSGAAEERQGACDAPERAGADDKLTYRWTQDHSFFSVLDVQPTNRELVLRMSNGGRPDTTSPARVTVYLADHNIGTADPDGQFRDHVFAIPAELAQQLAQNGGAAEVRIESTTWTPREVIGGVDNRRLGVMIDRAEIR